MGSRRLMVNISGLSSDCSDLITINQDRDMVLVVTDSCRMQYTVPRVHQGSQDIQ